MSSSISERPLLKAKILATLLKLANAKGDVDFNNPSSKSIWELDGKVEEYLFELNSQRAIVFDQIGDEGFAPIILCSVSQQTHEHLLNCLGDLSADISLLDNRVQALLRHDPNKLRSDILDSKKHIQDAREQLDKSPLLAALKQPLDDIARHFESIQKVAENYDDIYKNILLPVQEEGRSGIKATVKWAIIGIVASWLISNVEKIWDLVTKVANG